MPTARLNQYTATGLFGPPGLVAQLPLMLDYERGQEIAQIQSLTDVVTTVLEIRARTPCVQLTRVLPEVSVSEFQYK
ncbi:hypothetical protein DPMN_182769 [Dreissena polymorpha]|uniref:Uncharacterized protein n=1 Tax=Dreissena polymorpha TaxID=45954 RepID=A0A9D4I5R0_DREPO|nr:hypothetical protein DPMN_182769 [Dreissena polymorpha]